MWWALERDANFGTESTVVCVLSSFSRHDSANFEVWWCQSWQENWYYCTWCLMFKTIMSKRFRNLKNIFFIFTFQWKCLLPWWCLEHSFLYILVYKMVLLFLMSFWMCNILSYWAKFYKYPSWLSQPKYICVLSI